MLKSVQNQQASTSKTSPSRTLTVSTSSLASGGEKSKITSPTNPPRTSRSSLGGADKIASNSRTNSTSSLNVLDDKDGHEKTGLLATETEIEQLREENEFLNIKVNKLKYDLKLRDTTVDDLKVRITAEL